MEFYKNNILHLLILQAYVMYKSRKEIKKNDLINDFIEIFPQIKKDFFIDLSLSNAEERMCKILDDLEEINLLKINSDDEISWSENKRDVAGMLASLWLESLPAD